MYEHLRAVDLPPGDEQVVRARAAVLRRRRRATASIGAAALITTAVALVAVGVDATGPRSDTLTPVAPPSGSVAPTAVPTPSAAFTLGPTDTSANGFGWGVPAVALPTNDKPDGVPGWVAPPIGRCQSMTFAARDGGAPSPDLVLRVGVPDWTSTDARGVDVPLTIENTGPQAVALAFSSRAQVLGVPTGEFNQEVTEVVRYTVEPGQSLSSTAHLVPVDCADTSTAYWTSLPAGTYRVGVELVVDGYYPWYATSEPVTVR